MSNKYSGSCFLLEISKIHYLILYKLSACVYDNVLYLGNPHEIVLKKYYLHCYS